MAESRYPSDTFKAEYPYNYVTVTSSGHEIHVNDTPGSESLRVVHTKGTFVDIDGTGRWNQVVNGQYFSTYKQGYTETVDGQKDVKVGGVLNHNVDNSINDVSGGDRSITTGGHLIINTGDGRFDAVTGDMSTTVDGDTRFWTGQNEYRTVVGEQVFQVNQIKKDILGDSWQVSCEGDVEHINTNGTYRIKSKNIVLEADSIVLKTGKGLISLADVVNMIIDGSMNITTTANTTITSAAIHLNDV
jgi:hypothetical protein